MDYVLLAGALGVSVAGAGVDVVRHRIPNVLTYSGMAIAIVLRLVVEGWGSAVQGLLGGLIGGGIFLVFFLLHVMGGGDLKLMTAVCCFAGPQKAIEIVLAAAIAGGVLALLYAIVRGQLRRTLGNLGAVLYFHATAGAKIHPTLNLANPEAVRMPYGLAIAAGVLFAFLGTIR